MKRKYTNNEYPSSSLNKNGEALNGSTFKALALDKSLFEEIIKVKEDLMQKTGMSRISHRQVLDVLIHSYKANNQ